MSAAIFGCGGAGATHMSGSGGATGSIAGAASVSGAAIDPLALGGRYTSKFDLSTAGGKSAGTPSTLRALGYARRDPMISQRVANETAHRTLSTTRPPAC